MGSINTPEVSSANRCEPGSFPLRTANYPIVEKLDSIDPNLVSLGWIESFNKAITSPETAELLSLFLDESYWRDHLCLSWDFHTFHGLDQIIELTKKTNGSRIKSVALDNSSEVRNPSFAAIDAAGEVQVATAFLTIETDVGRGEGLVRLVFSRGNWKAFTLYTVLKALHSHDEPSGINRPHGATIEGSNLGTNWLDRRVSELKFEDEEPTVLIVGAGQAGLTVAARLKMLGVQALIVDREKRVGDSWRRRYHHLVLHDVVWFDHLPYIPFPETWPVFAPKDKLAEWFEAYARTMELNIWTQTNVTSSSWDATSRKWTVTLSRTQDGHLETRMIHLKHIIQATGASGEPNFPSDLKGLSSFPAASMSHSSTFTEATPSHGQNKRAVIVGACNSAHDIAQDFYNKGYHVTIVQQSTTCVIGVESMQDSMAPPFCQGGPATEDADLIFQSVPNPVLKRMNLDVTIAQNKHDEKILEGLLKAGFRLDNGPDDSGLWIKYLQRGGGYYLDVGGSQLIIDGKIHVKNGSISEVLPNGLKFEDGGVLDANEIVFATGYLNMRTTTRKIFGDSVADKVFDVWGVDTEGEIRTMWRNSGHPGFWFMGGNLALCRFYSRLLALQIKGLEEGIYKCGDI